MKLFALAVIAALVASAAATIHFEETFNDAGWEDRWVQSSLNGDDQGEWTWTAGKWYGDEDDKGIQTGQDARKYGLSAMIETPFSNEGSDLVLQYSVKHEQKLDCGGGYIKLLPASDQADFGGDSDYYIMFGPDICGPGTKKVHVIFNYKGENHLIEKDIKCETDQLSHLYTLIVSPDNTYVVKIDGKEVASGSLNEDWSMLPPQEIKDPEASKPDDWVDEAEMDDPEDVKPAGWDDIPELIPDPDAEKPDDWDDELDGEWEPPLLDNPDYKGEWKARRIPNPDYEGPWVHPMIPNPDYTPDDTLYAFNDIAMVGFEIWQVKSGSIFDNIIVTDSVTEAEAHAEKHFFSMKDGEKDMWDTAEEERREKEEAERKEREEARKAREEEERLRREEEEALESDEEEWEDEEDEDVPASKDSHDEL